MIPKFAVATDSQKPDAAVPAPRAPAAHSQTLSRGIRVLEILAETDEPMTIVALAAALSVHRSIAYRILRTLEDHGLVVRDPAGRVRLGPRLAALARGVSRDLQAAALPVLTRIANELGMTAFVAVLDQSEVVTLVSIESRQAHATVAQRPGTRHALHMGAPGIAIQSGLSASQWAALGHAESRRSEAGEVAALGYASSHDEVIAGLSSIAVPLLVPGESPASLAVVYISSLHSPTDIGAALTEAARTIVAELS
ncbi:MAG: helix-turn-helix domain-containing protein [Cryobacterium sp.]|uniref:IclR family transcriptional regulator n=1 Tax=Cryobacterium sp. TaxID=1926290 RepID=UPI002290487A|nr:MULTISPECIES: helix-turn-helix domain-containing protein [unclassified Cryobacterium]MCY7405492.1 helix-turn-helix domain-containing protein [Cryobacterium sp.]